MKDYLKKAMQGGLWIQPICFIAMLNIAYSVNHDNLLSLGTWIASFVFSFVPVLLIMMEKMNKPSSENARGEHEKKRALYPDVPQELLFDTPTGIMFGIWKGKYTACVKTVFSEVTFAEVPLPAKGIRQYADTSAESVSMEVKLEAMKAKVAGAEKPGKQMDKGKEVTI